MPSAHTNKIGNEQQANIVSGEIVVIDPDPDSDSNYESCVDMESRDAIARQYPRSSASVEEHGTRNQFKESTSRKRQNSTLVDYRAPKLIKTYDLEDVSVSEAATELRHEQPRYSKDAKRAHQHFPT